MRSVLSFDQRIMTSGDLSGRITLPLIVECRLVSEHMLVAKYLEALWVAWVAQRLELDDEGSPFLRVVSWRSLTFPVSLCNLPRDHKRG